jgi:hypothetical protein
MRLAAADTTWRLSSPASWGWPRHSLHPDGLAALLLSRLRQRAQEPTSCRVLCAPEFAVEPTISFTNIFGSPRILRDDGTRTREPRTAEFEVILSLGLPTRVSWLKFTVEAIFLPFDRDSTPELEFEANFVWLPAETYERLADLEFRYRRQVQSRRATE